MTLTAFFLLLLSVTFHASWNLIAKKSTMSITYYMVICMTSACCWLHLQFWTPVNIFALPGKYYLLMFCSVLSDLLYCCGLVRAYRTMEMSTAYPMMRSLPLLFTAAITGILGLGKPLTPMAFAGMSVVFAGCMLMPLKSFSDFKLSNYLTPTIFFVFYTALGTTGYTVFDSQGLQILREYCAANGIDVSKPVISLTYYSTRSLCLVTTLFTVVLLMKDERAAVKEYWKERNFMPLIGGLCASGTYVLVLIAMNYVTNVSYVQVCRQLGLPIGMAAGIIFLKEKSSPVKWIGVCLILIGFAVAVLCK